MLNPYCSKEWQLSAAATYVRVHKGTTIKPTAERRRPRRPPQARQHGLAANCPPDRDWASQEPRAGKRRPGHCRAAPAIIGSDVYYEVADAHPIRCATGFSRSRATLEGERSNPCTRRLGR